MPISDPSSYPGTVDEFLGSWTNANAAAAPETVVVAPEVLGEAAITRANLVTHRDELTVARTAVQDALNAEGLERSAVLALRRTLLERFELFGLKLRAFYGSTIYAGQLPVKPTESELPSRFLDAMDDVASLWGKMNADTAPAGVTLPLTLAGGGEVGDFLDVIAELRAALLVLSQREQDTGLARAARNKVQDVIYPILRDYRLSVPATLGKNDPVTLTLPRLTPLAGKTPTAVSASGSFLEPENVGKVLYAESPDADVDHYDLRFCPPPTYRSEDETIVASNGPGAAREFLTNVGLLGPGDIGLFKVYVVNTGSREKGSNVVDIRWPV